MNERQKFSRDLVWIATAQTLYFFLVGIVTLPALTKSYTTDIYGVWVQVRITVVLLAPVLTLQLGIALVRFLAAEESVEKRRQAFGAMLWPVLVFACLVVIMSELLSKNLSAFLFGSPFYSSFVPLAFLWASLEALFTFFIYYLRAREKIKTISVVQIAFSLSSTALILILATAGYSLEWVIASVIAAEALFVAVFFGMIVRDLGFPKPNFGGLGHFLAFSVPQIPGGVLLWILNASDRYFIAHLINLSQAGIYSASYTLGSLLSLFVNPINFVLFPTITKFWEQNEPSRVRSYLEYSTKLFLTLAIPGAVGLYMLSQPLLKILTTSEYAVGASLVLLIALGITLYGVYQINVWVIYLIKKTKWLPLMIGVAAAANAGINIALIPRYGIMGAAISTIVSYFVLATIMTIWAMRVVHYKLDYSFLSKIVVASLAMALCLRFIKVNGALSIFSAVIAGGTTFVLGLFVLRAFSKQDQKLVKEAIAGLNPALWIKGLGKKKSSDR